MLSDMSRGGSEMSRAEWASRGFRCNEAALRGIAADQSLHFGKPRVDGHESTFVREGFEAGWRLSVVSQISSLVCNPTSHSKQSLPRASS